MRQPSLYARTLAGLVIAALPGTTFADTYTFSITPPESLELIDGVNGLQNITSGTFNLTGLIGYSQTETTGLIILDPDDPLDDISQPATIGSGVKMGLLEVDSGFEVLMATGFFESPMLANDANFEAIVGAVRPSGPTDYTLYLPSDTTQPLRTQLTTLELEPLEDNIDVFVEVGLLIDPTIQIAPSMDLLNPDAEVFELRGDPLDGTPTWFVGIGGATDPGGSSGGGGTATASSALAGMKPHGTIAIGGCIRGSLCTAVWTGSAGDWNTPSDWDIGLVPFNGNFDGSTFNVLIDNGAGGASTTTLANNVQIVNLTISTGDRLDLVASLGVTGGTLTNQGEIVMNSVSSRLDILDSLSLTGGGELILHDPSALIRQFSGSTGLINDDHTIRGHGTINSTVTNSGTIRAEEGTLNLAATNNAGGAIEIASDGILNLTGAVTGGNVHGELGGLISGNTLANLTTTGTLRIRPQDLRIEGVITNNGTITYEDAMSSGESLFVLGDVILAGTGEVVLNSNVAGINVFSGSPTLTSANTIRGNGTINVPMINQHVIRAEGGTLNLGTTDNSAGIIQIAADGILNLTGPVTGGAVSGSAGSFISGNSIKDLTTSGTLTIRQQDLRIEGTITNNGTITYEDAGASGESLYVIGGVTLGGTGEVVLNSTLAQVAVFSGSPSLTSTNTIRGLGTINVAMVNQGTIRAEGGVLNLGTTDNSAGVIEIASDGTLNLTGTVSGGTLDAAAGSLIRGNTLKDLTTSGTLTIAQLDLRIEGTITNDGTITFENAGVSGESLFPIGHATLAGAGEVVLNSSLAGINLFSGITSLTSTNTIRGLGSVSIAVTNQGTIRAEGGTLNLTTVDNALGTIEIAADGVLSFTAVTGGNVVNEPGSMIRSGRLTDVAASGTMTLTPADLTLEGAITNAGVITFENNAIVSQEVLFLFGPVTLDGGGEVVLNSTDAAIVNGGGGGGGGRLNNVDNTIRGFGSITAPVTNQHDIVVDGGTLNLATTDNTGGTIKVNAGAKLNMTGTLSGGTLNVMPGGQLMGPRLANLTTAGTVTTSPSDLTLEGTITNTGVITFENNPIASEETLFVFGPVTLDGMGEVVLNSTDAAIRDGGAGNLTNVDNTIRGFGSISVPVTNQHDIVVDGGTLNLATTDNTGGTIKVNAGAKLNMTGTLSGGTLNLMPGAQVMGGRLKDLTTVGTLLVTPSDVFLEGTITNTGAIEFEDNPIASQEALSLFGPVTLNGGGEVVMNSADAAIVNAGGGSLTNVDNTIRGFGSIHVPVVNDGVIRAEGGKLTLNSADVGGDGSMFIEAGAELEFNGNTLHQHTISVDPAGEFDFNGSRLEVVDFVGDLALEFGDTFAPGSSPALSTVDGSFTMVANTVLEIEVVTPGITVGTDFDQLNVVGPVTLAGTLKIVPEDGLSVAPGTEMTVVTFPSRTGVFDAVEGSLVDTTSALVPGYGDTAVTLRASIPGDVNFDDSVSVADLSTFALNFNTAPGLFDEATGVRSWELGDFNADGLVTVADLSLLALNFGVGTEASTVGLSLAEAAAIAGIDPALLPEPGVGVLLGVGLAGFGRRRGRVAGV